LRRAVVEAGPADGVGAEEGEEPEDADEEAEDEGGGGEEEEEAAGAEVGHEVCMVTYRTVSVPDRGSGDEICDTIPI
jgi:hypothetical protein